MQSCRKCFLGKQPWSTSRVNFNSHSLFIEPYHLNCEFCTAAIAAVSIYYFLCDMIEVATVFYLCQRTHHKKLFFGFA